MSFLGKLFVVEEKNNTQFPEGVSFEDFNTPKIEVVTSGEFDPATVDQIYALFPQLKTVEQSIYKVKEFGAAFPDSLPKETRKAALLGVLATAGFKTEELIADSEERKTLLNSAKDTVLEENNKKIEALGFEIGTLVQKIEELKTQVVNYGKMNEAQEEIVAAEIKKIEEIENLIK